MKAKLTKTVVEQIASPEQGELLVWDTALKGFGLRVTEKGARSYIVQHKVKGGKKRRVTLGRHGILTCQQARQKAAAEMGAMADGLDPVTEREREKAVGVTLAHVVDSYLEDRTLKERSRADIRRHLENSFSAWAGRPVSEITRDNISRRFRELSGKSKAQANQAFRVLRALLEYARAQFRAPDGQIILPENPVQVLSDVGVWHRIRPRNSYIPLDKVGAWWSAIQARRDDPALSRAGRIGADVVAFLLLTGLRWGEAAALGWEHVDLETGTLRIADTKNRHPITLPLADTTLALLEARPRDGEFVFPGRSAGHVDDARVTLGRLAKETGVEVSPHDLRRTFRAVAGQCGIEFWKIKALMNHSQSQDVTLGSYTDLEHLAYLKPEAGTIAVWIEEQRVRFEARNVVDMKARHA